jgi:hypothetical protein
MKLMSGIYIYEHSPGTPGNMYDFWEPAIPIFIGRRADTVSAKLRKGRRDRLVSDAIMSA